MIKINRNPNLNCGLFFLALIEAASPDLEKQGFF